MEITNNSFCTIVTKDYLAWSLTFYEAIRAFDDAVILNVLVTDVVSANEISIGLPVNVIVYTIEDVNKSDIAQKLHEKYKAQPNVLRWSFKPVFMSFLLTKFDKVIYSDSDIYYCNDYQFLFNELETNNVLLTPHWRSKDPEIDKSNFQLLFNGGLYNGGFVAANKKGKHILQFWAKNCLEICELNLSKGHFADQTHLNLLPIYFDNVKVLKHRGCNIANWNQIECKRTKNEKTNEVTIQHKYPIVFIHFTKSTIIGVIKGVDPLLAPYLAKFNTSIVNHGFENLIDKYTSELSIQRNKSVKKLQPTLIMKIKMKIKKIIS